MCEGEMGRREGGDEKREDGRVGRVGGGRKGGKEGGKKK